MTTPYMAEMFVLPRPFAVPAVAGVVLLIVWGLRRDRLDPPSRPARGVARRSRRAEAMKLPCFTIRRLMIALVVVGLMLGLVLWMNRRSAEFQRKALFSKG